MGHAAPIKPTRTQLEAAQALQRMVVVVEDDDAMRQAIQRLLKCAGLQSRVFATAHDFLESGTAGSAACLVLDVQLPDQSGFELHRVLASRGLNHPVIFITGLDDPTARAEAARIGAVEFLSKPFPGRQLIAAIENAVGGDD